MNQTDALRAVMVWPNPFLPPLEPPLPQLPLPKLRWPFEHQANPPLWTKGKSPRAALYAYYAARCIASMWPLPDDPFDITRWWDPLANMRIELQEFIDQHDDRAHLTEACRAALATRDHQQQEEV
jgi:hypothetical protein